MLFNSYVFVLLFLPLCIIGYFSLNHFGKYSAGQFFLLVMSLWFYGYYNISYLFVILTSMLINYGVYLLILKFAGRRTLGKGILFSGIVLNLGILIYFKYHSTRVGST